MKFLILRKLEHEALDIHANNEFTQKAWAVVAHLKNVQNSSNWNMTMSEKPLPAQRTLREHTYYQRMVVEIVLKYI